MKRFFTTTAIAFATLLALWIGGLALLVFESPDQPLVERPGCFAPSMSLQRYWLIRLQHHPELALTAAAVLAAVAVVLWLYQRRSAD